MHTKEKMKDKCTWAASAFKYEGGSFDFFLSIPPLIYVSWPLHTQEVEESYIGGPLSFKLYSLIMTFDNFLYNDINYFEW